VISFHLSKKENPRVSSETWGFSADYELFRNMPLLLRKLKADAVFENPLVCLPALRAVKAVPFATQQFGPFGKGRAVKSSLLAHSEIAADTTDGERTARASD